jgi:hypothetical protein
MSTYYAISHAEMHGLMTALHFERVEVPGTYEYVYARPVQGKDLEVRIYTSIDSRGEARDVGSDAIRLVIFSPKHNRGVGSESRVYRTTGWRSNLQKRFGDIWEQAQTGLTKCKCGEWMVMREGKHGKFLGCVAFPRCRETRSLIPVRPTTPAERETVSAYRGLYDEA